MAAPERDPETGPDDVLACALALGSTWKRAARMAGVSQSTIARRLRDPAFRKKVSDYRREAVGRTVGKMLAILPEAAAALARIVKERGAKDRIPALRLAFEVGLKLRDSEDLEERIRQLEEQAAAGGDAPGVEDDPASDRPGLPAVGGRR